MAGDAVVADCAFESRIADAAPVPAADANAEGDVETRFGNKLKTSCKFARMA